MKKTPDKSQPKTAQRREGYASQIAPKAISQARQDVATWKMALRQAEQVNDPKRVRLQYLYRDILLDALLTSQIENRKRMTTGSAFVLKDKSGNIDVENTALLQSASWFNQLRGYIQDTTFMGTTVIEFITDDTGLKVVLLPRTNIAPEKGLLLFDENSTTGTDYRVAKEYGTWVLEFGNPKDFGLLNKAVPHILFKRFAQSCWSELCEIYGIPPRVLKTNTRDGAMLTRAEQMMRDMGAAAWFIIDESETFEFATGVSTKGEVYESLIRLCSNETCLLISGAVIGQDTKNGNQSKEKVSIGMLESLVDSDKRNETSAMNEKVLPALFRIGYLPDGLTYEYEPQEDIEQLYIRTIGFAPYVELDPEWIKEKFGVEVTALKQPGGKGANFQ